jgi:hypothetical protein
MIYQDLEATALPQAHQSLQIASDYKAFLWKTMGYVVWHPVLLHSGSCQLTRMEIMQQNYGQVIWNNGLSYYKVHLNIFVIE